MIVAGVAFLVIVALVVKIYSLKATIAETKAQATQEKAEAMEGFVVQLREARAREQAAVGRIHDIETAYVKLRSIADENEDRLAAALRSGERRVHPAVCKTGTGVPGNASTAGKPDAAADDGARRIAAVVARAERADAQIAGLQRYSEACHALTRGKP